MGIIKNAECQIDMEGDNVIYLLKSNQLHKYLYQFLLGETHGSISP